MWKFSVLDMQKHVLEKQKWTSSVIHFLRFSSFLFVYPLFFLPKLIFSYQIQNRGDLDRRTEQSCSFGRGIGICVALLNTASALHIMNWYTH
jgi:hypothetical protein